MSRAGAGLATDAARPTSRARRVYAAGFGDHVVSSRVRGRVGHSWATLRRLRRRAQHVSSCIGHTFFDTNQDLSLAEIAASVGLADQSHFSHHFTRVTGATGGPLHAGSTAMSIDVELGKQQNDLKDLGAGDTGRQEARAGMFMKTALCHMLGIEYPIIAAPMGPDLTGPELVAAVSNAGGLGILQAQFLSPPLFREQIHRVRALTVQPFGVNLLLHFPIEDQVAVCLEEHVPVLAFFWGDPTPYVDRAHAAGVKVFHQVGSVLDAQRAAAAGVDVIIAQGAEAGGHVAGEVSTLALVPRVVDAIAPRPVAAAGGIADARGLVAVLALGAQAAVLGTRFLASVESHAHPHYKQKLLDASEADTVRTILFGHGWPNAPHRTLRTAFVREWLGREERGQESRPDEPVIGHTVIGGQPMPVLRFMGFPPNSDASGDIDSMDLLAGQSVGLIRDIKPAGQIVDELVEEARQIISQRLAGLIAAQASGG